MDSGFWRGVAFDVALFGGLVLFAWVRGWMERRIWRRGHPPAPGSAARGLARIKRLIRPTLLLVPAKEPGFSKLGGDPELSDDLEWPAGDEGPRVFVAQIELAALRPHVELDWLPAEGRIYAFYDPDQHGCADVVRVLYSTAPPGPAITPPRGTRWRSPERRVAFMLFGSAPSLDWLDVDQTTFDADFEDIAEEILPLANPPPPDEVQHRIGGYPDEIQSECMRLSCEHLARGLPPPVYGVDAAPAVERASKQWRMLLQIDSDPGLKMNWGDGGRLYVFIREKDGQAGDFSKTVALWQTY